MANSIKEQQDILSKLNIQALNPMQEEAVSVINDTINTILLSPTGTGKTLLLKFWILNATTFKH
jgi:Lhr-like helicase